MRSIRFRQPAIAALFIASFACHGSASADDSRASQAPILPKYQQECAACHVAFPPHLLPAQSWQRIMSGLPHHFGTDASLDVASTKEIADWLTRYGGTGKRAREAPPEDRITRSAWFVREHREVPAPTWKLPAVKSATNCAACHTRANTGDFNERYIVLPR